MKPRNVRYNTFLCSKLPLRMELWIFKDPENRRNGWVVQDRSQILFLSYRQLPCTFKEPFRINGRKFQSFGKKKNLLPRWLSIPLFQADDVTRRDFAMKPCPAGKGAEREPFGHSMALKKVAKCQRGLSSHMSTAVPSYLLKANMSNGDWSSVIC